MKQKVSIIFFLLITLWTCVFLAPAVSAQKTGIIMEYKIKAAFLLNFAKFINWPEGSFSEEQQPFKICVLGRNPFGSVLEDLESRMIANRKIKVHYVDTLAAADWCHLVFVSSSEKNNLAEIQKSLADRAIILVSDIEGFVESGGLIEFVSKGEKLAFKINLSRAREQGLEIHSALLNLATEVI